MNDLQMARDGDLAIQGHDIRPTDSIEQGIYIRLRWWFNEWKFGPGYGVKYFEDILVKNPNKALVISDIREQIMGVDGVIEVENINVAIDHKKRAAVIKYTAITESRERFEREVEIWNTA